MATLNFLSGKIESTKSGGAVNDGGKVYFYVADGTYTTPLTSYSDRALTTPNAHPLILDAAGRGKAYISGNADCRITDSADVAIYTELDVSPQNAKSVVAKASNFTVDATYADFVIETTAALTISLTSAATLGSGFSFTVINLSSGSIQLNRLNAGNTINGVAADTAIGGNSSATITVNAAATGFLVDTNDISLFTSSVRLIATQTASASALLEFTIDNTFGSLMFEMVNLVSSGSAVELCMQQSVASTYLTASYQDMSMRTVCGTSGYGDITSASRAYYIVTPQTVPTGAVGGNIRVYGPGQAGNEKIFLWDTLCTQGGTGVTIFKGSGCNRSNTGAIDKIKFYFLTGNITSGTIRMYGIPK